MAVIEFEDHGEENQAATLAYLGRSDRCTRGFEQTGLISPRVTDDDAPH